MNGHGNEMTGYDPEAEQAMADLWREWEFCSQRKAEQAEADKYAKRAERWFIAAAAVGVAILWFLGAEVLHHILTK